MASVRRFKLHCSVNSRSILGSIGILSTFFFGSLYLYHSLFIRSPRSFNGQYNIERVRGLNITEGDRENVPLAFLKRRTVVNGLNNNFRSNVLQSKEIEDLEPKKVIQKNLAPICSNILQNITKGRWVKRIELLQANDKLKEMLKMKEAKLGAEVAEFWVKRGIQMSFWRPDKKCGYNKLVPYMLPRIIACSGRRFYFLANLWIIYCVAYLRFLYAINLFPGAHVGIRYRL